MDTQGTGGWLYLLWGPHWGIGSFKANISLLEQPESLACFQRFAHFRATLTISFMTWQLTNLLTPSSQLSWQKMMKNYVMQWCMTAAFHCRDRLQYLFHTQIAHLRLFFYRRNGLGACLVEVLYNKQQHKLEAVGDAKQLPRIFQKFFTNFTRNLH